MHKLTHIRIKHLRLLEQLMEHRTLRKAAVALHVSEPAASQMLKEMEATLGVKLFERGRRGMTPNETSTLLLNRARVILRELYAMASDITDLSSQRNELIHLGALPRCMYALVPTALANLYSQGFQPRIEITEGSSSQLIEALDCGELDLALTRITTCASARLSASKFNTVKLLDEETSIVCATNHPALKMKRLCLQDLIQFDWVLPAANSMTRKLIDTEFINNGLTPPTPKIEGRTATSLKLVQNSLFLSICPSSVAREWVLNTHLSILPITLETSLPPISIIWRTSKADNPSILAIKDALLRFAHL